MRVLQLATALLLSFTVVLAVPADPLVATPAGLLPQSQVHLIPKGGRVRHTSDSTLLLDRTGSVIHRAPHTKGKKLQNRFASGWVAYANWYNNLGSPIKNFVSTWTVPIIPHTYTGQTLFYFNSIEPSTGDSILQPVLQYGPSAAGGGNYWAITSWYVTGSGAYYNPLVTVSPGQSLTGTITCTGYSGSNFNYTTYFNGYVDSTALSLEDFPELVWATETLEVYGVTASTNFPTGHTTFSGINLQTFASNTPLISWATVNDVSDGLTASVIADGSVNAQVQITYPNQ